MGRTVGPWKDAAPHGEGGSGSGSGGGGGMFNAAIDLVQGSGFRVQGSGFRVQGSGFRVQDSGFKEARRRAAEEGWRCAAPRLTWAGGVRWGE